MDEATIVAWVPWLNTGSGQSQGLMANCLGCWAGGWLAWLGFPYRIPPYLIAMRIGGGVARIARA